MPKKPRDGVIRDEYIRHRATKTERSKLELAADIKDTNLSNFILTAALTEADRVIADQALLKQRILAELQTA